MTIAIAVSAAFILSGLLLIVIGIIQCCKRIEKERHFISAEAEIIEMDHKLSVISYNFIPVAAAKEYSPIVAFRTEDGREIKTAMPFALKVSGECRELYRMYETKTPITIYYNNDNPKEIYYRKKDGFRIREALYKLFAGGLLIVIGSFLIVMCSQI